jgi:hypothetical protein
MEEQMHTQENQLMSITDQAVDVALPTNTPCVQITIGGKRTVALLDLGSTSTFIDQQFAIKANCPLMQASARAVQIAGGGSLVSSSFVPECEFLIGTHKFTHPFRVLSLPGHDVLLGCYWMKQFSPVSFHFQKQEFHLSAADGSAIILPTCSPSLDSVPIDSVQLYKLLDKGAT